MEYTWSLKELFPSFDSEEFKNCFEELKREVESIRSWTQENLNERDSAKEKIETYISMLNRFSKYYTLSSFASLTLSADSNNLTARRALEQLGDIFAELTNSNNKFHKFIEGTENLDELINSSEVLKSHEFYLNSIKENSKYMLGEKEEYMYAKLKQTGSVAFGKQRELLTSNLSVKYGDGEIPLSEIRSLAYDENTETRKNAYLAELEAYKKIEDSVAYSLNGIKGEVITMSRLRGFDSPLDMTLYSSRMDRKTLDAMLNAIKEFLPVFRKYFAKKAELLGHKNGLPFYDLFAPVGKINMKFTYEQAQAFILDNFYKFGKNLGDLADRAFKNNWIDVAPRYGKVGGAFCSNLHSIGESRILTNFTGSFNDCMTIAHELGHAYHGGMLMDETWLNSKYTMPIAETASTMCETIMSKAAMKTATQEEAFVILENDIMGAAQVIVDIYSRFLFEDEVFKRRQDGSLSAGELKEIMLESQKSAYGEALDEEYLHPYMWICKPHYYYADSNYYNFPYAYGLLFSKGLYAMYLRDGSSFVELYESLLSETGKNKLYEVGKIAGIDTANQDFWISSLKLIEEDIDKFVSMK